MRIRPPSLFGWSIDPSRHPRTVRNHGVGVASRAVDSRVSNLRRGAAGRRLLAVRSNERAAAALGLNVLVAKLYAFMLASAIAGVGGCTSRS